MIYQPASVVHGHSAFSELTFAQLSSFLDVTVKSTDRLTRLGLYGGPRGLYGNFAGKVASEITIEFFGAGDDAESRFEDERLILAIIKAFMKRVS